MADLTVKELAALSDQLSFEKVLCCKYLAAERACTEGELKTAFGRYAAQHRQNYGCLLHYLE